MKVLKVHEKDNVWIALEDIEAHSLVSDGKRDIKAKENIAMKHKMAIETLELDDPIIMYGTVAGRANRKIESGCALSTDNVRHDTQPVEMRSSQPSWHAPDTSEFKQKEFAGYHRSNGEVGTRNFWLVIPLVFCENRNLQVIQDSLLGPLGYQRYSQQVVDVTPLIEAFRTGHRQFSEIRLDRTNQPRQKKIFPQIDGIKFLRHESGCGGSRQDADMLCRLLATYVNHANVAGASILSLGCQNAQVSLLKKHLHQLNPHFDKPIFYFEQQESRSEKQFITDILKRTFEGLITANGTQRKSTPLSKLTLGLECGGSDGFSGLSANPALGFTSDLLVALGGRAILSEFPELHGAEQDIIGRCRDRDVAEKFLHLMEQYQFRAREGGSGFEANPSPGNIADGLITDAIKSLGAARKGGTSPVEAVLDYGEVAKIGGLHLLCTPGNDVESTTGLASAGANVIVFTTGLGTPTGNAIAPTIKMSSNSDLARRMHDIIDIDSGSIITGDKSIQYIGKQLLKLIIETASGEFIPAAERLGQEDFIPWRRGISL